MLLSKLADGEHMFSWDSSHWVKRSHVEHLLPLTLLQGLNPGEVLRMRELFQHLLQKNRAAVDANLLVVSGRVQFVPEDLTILLED